MSDDVTVPRLSISDLAILLVEPSNTQSKIITHQLGEVGNFNIESASSPEEAWAIMKRAVPDLVISAMYFDQSTGSELVQRMRADPDLEIVPFVLVSSENRWASLEPIKQAGVMAILSKPFAIGDLSLALHAAAEFVDDEMVGLEDVDLESIRVLVVDDSQTARNHIIKLLEKIGLEQISWARDGLEAVGMMDESIYDLLITDYNMPQMDGERLVNHIRNNSIQTSIPIIMITSENNEARLDAVVKSGVSAICNKPFDMGSIRTLIQQLLTQ
jgi:two-component system chemotaxis response regulator CheY